MCFLNVFHEKVSYSEIVNNLQDMYYLYWWLFGRRRWVFSFHFASDKLSKYGNVINAKNHCYGWEGMHSHIVEMHRGTSRLNRPEGCINDTFFMLFTMRQYFAIHYRLIFFCDAYSNPSKIPQNGTSKYCQVILVFPPSRKSKNAFKETSFVQRDRFSMKSPPNE